MIRLDEQTVELQSNGQRPDYTEAGTVGLDAWSGYIQEAYNAELYWPEVYTLYNRLRRSDPEITIIRHLYNAMAHDVRFEWELPEEATPADVELNDYLNTLLDDIEGGQRRFIGTLVSHVPFMGWGWWEAVPGLRQEGWKAPDSKWQSQNDDGRIGFRKMAWRDHSSFQTWDMDDKTGELFGMTQNDAPNEVITIPLDESVHITFGDSDNPEGLSPLEAVWRLERIKYGLEIVQGIGYEHTAGHLKIKVFDDLDAPAKAIVRQAAKAVLTAQEGNYVTEIKDKFEADIMDTPFAAAPAILEAIRYYGLLKLQVYNMQWVSIASTSGGGAYSAMQDSSTMMLSMWNAMMSGFAEQAGAQLWDQAKRYNPDLFASATLKQRLNATPIEKEIPLGDMAQLLPVLFQLLPMDDEDFVAIRRKLKFLPETLPEVEEGEDAQSAADASLMTQEKVLNGAQITSAIAIIKAYSEGLFPREIAVNMLVNFFNLSRGVAEQLVPQESQTKPQETGDNPFEDDEPEDDDEMGELQQGPRPEDSSKDAIITEADIEHAMARFRKWAKKNDPYMATLLDAEIDESESQTDTA